LRPFEMTAIYCKADYRSYFAFYGAEFEPSVNEIEKSTQDYLNFIDNM
nr:flavodoxin family protein [Bacillus pacificus]